MAMLKYVTVTKRKSAKRFKVDTTAEDEVGLGDGTSESTTDSCETDSQNKMSTSQEAKDVSGRGYHRNVSGKGDNLPSGSGEEQTSKSRTTRTKGMVFKEVKGDLFASPETTCLAHCISADCRMGKGIATIFHKKFGGVQELLAQGVRPGGVAVLQRGQRYIYYMVTKEKYSNLPTYKDLQSSLDALRSHCMKHNVDAIAMPRIGCGLDGLEWKKVSLMIRDTFKHCDISISVYSL